VATDADGRLVGQGVHERRDEGEPMEKLAIIAHLKPGAEPEARRLIAAGPPFDLDQAGLLRHTVYLAADDVVFVFEGHEVEWLVDAVATDPFRWETSEALEQWRGLVDGPARIARAAFDWSRSDSQPAVSK
jgi:hypothetical protein